MAQPAPAADGHDLPGGLRQVRLVQRLADGHALGREEGVGHAAADDERIDLVDEVGE